MQVNITNETTTTTAKTSISSSSNEQDFSKEQEQVQPSTTATNVTEDTEVQKSKEAEVENVIHEEEDITASFTIIAPSTGPKAARPSSLIVTATSTTSSSDRIINDEEVSATFVMTPRKESRTPTPTTENVETTLVVKPEVASSPTAEEKAIELIANDGDEQLSKPSTHNKENENYENKKTEQPPIIDVNDVTIPTIKPIVLQEQSTKITHQQQTPSQRAQSSERIRATFFNPLPLVTQITTITTPTSSTTSTPTLDSPVRLRDKRSLFDTDNASPHTLADKLRGEANKYVSDEKRHGVFDAFLHDSLERDTSSPSNHNSRRSLDSSSLPNSPLHTRDREAGGSDNSSGCGGVSGSGGSYNNNLSADRRPSWRLKFDSGSKV